MWKKSSDTKPPLPATETAEPPAPISPPVPEPPRVESRNDTSRVSRSISIKGEIVGSADIFLDGEMEGKIRLTSACVTIGPNGTTRADIQAREIIVEGRVEGALEARDRVQVRRTAAVSGDITAPRVLVEDGALVEGKIETVQPPAPRSADSPVASPRGENPRSVPVEAAD
jgi:cytoskeletal protein CcmA (bactofilin family)